MSIIKKIVLWIIVLALLGGGIFLFWKSKQKGITYTLTPVARASIARTVSADGTYLSKEKADVSFRISGPITQLGVDVGDMVKKGQILAKIDTGVLEDNLKSAQGELTAQKQLLINMKNHEDSYSRAQRDAQRGAVQTAQGAVDEIQRQLQYVTITAPMDGTIAERNIHIGEIAQAGVSVITIIKGDEMRVEANVPEVDVAGIQAGQKVSIKFDAYGDDKRFAGTVSEIDPAAITVQNVSYYVVKINVDNPDANFKYGMNCTIYDITDQKDNALVVPKWAVTRENGKKFVTLMRDAQTKTVEKKEVQTGLEGDNGMVEITSGLSVNDQIAQESK